MSDRSKAESRLEMAMNEISVLREKLDSKSCALMILSQELLECKAQRDEFKLMGEQLRERYAIIKRKMEGLGPTLSAVYDYDGYDTPPNRSYAAQNSEPLAQLLITLKEQNKHLIREIDDLRMKLEDAEGDLKIVRSQMRSMSQHIDSAAAFDSRERSVDLNIISELEFYKNKVTLLERDLQSILDEKEELILSRDSYKLKVDRLNEKLNAIMRSPGSSANASNEENRIVDIDSLFMENRFLKERIKSYEEEKKMINLRLSKYKEILEKKRFDTMKGILSAKESLSLSNISGNVVTAREIEQLISTDALNNMEVNASNLSLLKNLLVALYDGLQDKTVNLSHAKKTNKLLGKRIEELEIEISKLRIKTKAQIVKTSSIESTSSSVASTSALEDATPDDANEANEDKTNVHRHISDRYDDNCDANSDDSDEKLPPELDRLVNDAINELKNKQISDTPSSHDSSLDVK